MRLRPIVWCPVLFAAVGVGLVMLGQFVGMVFALSDMPVFLGIVYALMQVGGWLYYVLYYAGAFRFWPGFFGDIYVFSAIGWGLVGLFIGWLVERRKRRVSQHDEQS